MPARAFVRRAFFVLLLPLALLAFAPAGCVEGPDDFKIEDLKVVSVKDKVLTVHLTGLLHNPNRLGAVVRESQYTLYVNDRELGILRSLRGFKLKGRKYGKFEAELQVKLPQLPALASALLFRLTPEARVEGTTRLRVLGIGMRRKQTFTLELDAGKQLLDLIKKAGAGG